MGLVRLFRGAPLFAGQFEPRLFLYKSFLRHGDYLPEGVVETLPFGVAGHGRGWLRFHIASIIAPSVPSGAELWVVFVCRDIAICDIWLLIARLLGSNPDILQL